MVQLMDGDSATNPAEDIGTESMRRGNVWERDGIVGAQGDACTNIVSNFTIHRESFARTTSTGSSRTVTTGSMRGSTGRKCLQHHH